MNRRTPETSRDSIDWMDSTPGPLEAGIVHALETPPEIAIPPGFAARVAARAAAEPQPSPSPWAGLGPRLALASGALLTLALFVFAGHASPSVLDLRFDLELFLLAELGVVGCLLTRTGLRD